MNTEKLIALRNQGLTPEEIAPILSADPDRFPQRRNKPGELAIALARSGHADPAGLLDRLISSIGLVAEQRGSVKAIASGFIDSNGDLDFGSPIVRSVIRAAAESGDVSFTIADFDAIAAAVPVPDPITAAEVTEAIRDQDFASELNAIAAALETAKADGSTVAEFRQQLANGWAE